MPIMTELDALLDRVREDKADSTGRNRNVVAYDCWRMFEDLATRYKEEFASRDRYKRQSNSWREKALELAGILERYVSAYPAFRIKPVGAPGSEKRIEQENLMALEDVAKTSLHGSSV